jgi:hypothetical protein
MFAEFSKKRQNIYNFHQNVYIWVDLLILLLHIIESKPPFKRTEMLHADNFAPLCMHYRNVKWINLIFKMKLQETGKIPIETICIIILLLDNYNKIFC